GSLTMYSFTLAITYLIFMFPFVFFLAPLIGVLILFYVVRRKGIKEVTFWIDLKPKKLVGWEEEKEVLKLLIALLPVSLYFLITLLKLLQLGLDPHVVGSTWLGWVLEIYMLFLLSFIVAVNLLYTSRVYHGNRFVGETIRRDTFNNLLSISIVLSSVSLILFVQIYKGIEYLFVYFALYYVAITIVFLSFFKIMEPASVYIFAKILTFIRDENKFQKVFDLRTAGLGVLVGALTALISLLYILYTGPLTFNWARTNVGLDELMNACSLYQSPYLDALNILNILISLGSLQRFFEIAIILGLIYVFRNTLKVKFFVAGVYVGIFKMITDYFLLQRGASKAWTTTVFSSLNIGSLNILVPRFAYLPLTTNQFIVIPMLLLKLLATLLVFTVLVYLKFGKLAQFTDVEAGHQIKYICEPEPDRITLNSLIKLKIARIFEDKVPEDLKQIVEFFKTKACTFQELKEKLGMPEEKLKKTLRYLYEKYIIDIYDVEFKIVTPAPVIEGIYIVNTDGIALYSQSFGEVKVEPLLISGMLSAITSFVKETTSSQQYLQAIDHGDVVLMIEYGDGFFVTLLANRETPELRMRLREFVKRFQEQYGEVLKQWSGDPSEFKGTEQLIKEIFEITPISEETPVT
ncbi:MAG: hypothetical protein ACTSYM_04225, partial [Candidatus Baldrarchaeia archaeon]